MQDSSFVSQSGLHSIRECNDGNPKRHRCVYLVKIDGVEVQRIYYLCDLCRKDLDFASGIVLEESVEQGSVL